MVIYFSIYLGMTITCLSHHWGHFYQTPSGGSYIHQLGHGLGRHHAINKICGYGYGSTLVGVKNHLEK